MGNDGCSHTYSEIFLHLNWHTKQDKPMIFPDVEARLHPFIEDYCQKVKGVHFEDVGGTEDHIHLLFQMEPSVAVDKFIGLIKGASAFEINRSFGRQVLRWQRGYGIVSFAKRNLPGLRSYVAKHKEHHANGTTKEALEEHGVDSWKQKDDG